MTSVRLPKELDKRLSRLAEKTERPKSYYLIKALEDFLNTKEAYLLKIASLPHDQPLPSREEILKSLLKTHKD